MTSLASQLQVLKRQVDASPLLKWAGLAIIALLVLFALQSLDVFRNERQKAAIEAELNLRKVLALKGQDVWLTREKSALQLRDTLKAQMPDASTPGFAQASLQSWLRRIADSFDTDQHVQVSINRAGMVPTMDDVIQVNASISGNLPPRQAINLLRQIETSQNILVVETFSLHSDSSQTLQLTLNAYYRKTAENKP